MHTIFMEEAGRDISERSGTDMLMIPQDFTNILLTHKQRELEQIQRAGKVFFEDTDCLITRFYLDFLEGKDKERNDYHVGGVSDKCGIWLCQLDEDESSAIGK